MNGLKVSLLKFGTYELRFWYLQSDNIISLNLCSSVSLSVCCWNQVCTLQLLDIDCLMQLIVWA